jgi:hypothetical protein
MTVRAEAPLEQLLASGLHRLAQPVSAALWVVELAQDPGQAPLPQLAMSMRRAADLLHAMRSLMEASAAYSDCNPECVHDLVEQVHEAVDAALGRGGIVCQPLQSSLRVCCSVDARGFRVAYRALLEKFLVLGATPATVRESLTLKDDHFELVVECDSPAIRMWTAKQRMHLFQELDPFEVQGFNFSSNVAPELTQARAILGRSGIALTGDVDDSVMRFRLQGAQYIF